MNLHAGAGVQYFMFNEDNPIGEVRENKLGLIARMGVDTRIMQKVWIDVFAEYSYCRMKPAEFEFDIGGPAAGIGLGYEF
jgi:opacity protein-like surface antigen